MDGIIRYIGHSPVYSFKMDWANGQSLSLESFYRHVKASIKRDLEEQDFINWLEQAVNGKDFLVDLSPVHESYEDENESTLGSSEQVTEVQVEKKKRGRPKKNTVLVESSSVKVAKSMAAAKEKLRQTRHPQEVGETVPEPTKGIKKNLTPSEQAKQIENTSSQVITGDDLDKSRHGTVETDRNARQGNVLVLDSQAEVSRRVPTSKEEQAEENAKLANLSGKVRVMQTEKGNDSSFIVDGGDKEQVLSSKNDNQLRPGKVNKYLQNQGGYTASERMITIDDFMKQTDETELARLINFCKDPITLKMVRIYYKDNGNHRIVEKLDARLRVVSKG